QFVGLSSQIEPARLRRVNSYKLDHPVDLRRRVGLQLDVGVTPVVEVIYLAGIAGEGGRADEGELVPGEILLGIDLAEVDQVALGVVEITDVIRRAGNVGQIVFGLGCGGPQEN